MIDSAYWPSDCKCNIATHIEGGNIYLLFNIYIHNIQCYFVASDWLKKVQLYNDYSWIYSYNRIRIYTIYIEIHIAIDETSAYTLCIWRKNNIDIVEIVKDSLPVMINDLHQRYFRLLNFISSWFKLVSSLIIRSIKYYLTSFEPFLKCVLFICKYLRIT